MPNPPGQHEELPIEARDAIEAELGSLKTTIDSLKSQRTAGEHKLHREAARARELTSQIVAARRDEDKAMLAGARAATAATAAAAAAATAATTAADKQLNAMQD